MKDSPTKEYQLLTNLEQKADLLACCSCQNNGKSEGQMKARVIQPLFAMDEAGLDASYEWTLRELRDCDPSLDIVVLPEFSEVPGKTSNEGFLETVH